MRTVAVATACLTVLAACSDLTRPRPGADLELGTLPPTTWDMRVGETRSIGDLRIRFIAVPTDSRCPIDAECPWAGNAEVQLNAEHAWGEGPAYPIRLNTGMEPRTAEVFNVRITLVALRPDPRGGVPIRQEDYRAELRLQGTSFKSP